MTVSTGVGLVSGIDIEALVTKLMDIEKRPVNALTTRIEDITSKKTIFVEMAARLLKLKISADSMFGTGSVFTTRKTGSSNESALTATAARGTALGTYSFTVKSLVQAHQMVSRGFASKESTVGAGVVTVEMGDGNVDRDTSLDSLNGGGGVSSGSILVTNRAGRSTTVDLSGAITVSDVLDAINGSYGIGVTASVDGDSIVLTDTTGQSSGNLSVEEAGGSTAADLGILASVAAATLTGSDVVAVGPETFLDALNDGRGVRTAYGLPDIRIVRRDDVAFTVDLSSAETVQDVLDAINGAAGNTGGLLVASVSADGKGLTFTDTTGGSADLVVEGVNGSLAASDLRIAGTVSSNTFNGGRVVAGLNTVLLASLNGGSGIGRGSIEITDRAGASIVLDLSNADTLSDVVDAINGSAVSVTATLNSSRTGLVLTDTSGGAGAFTVEDVDSTTAADLHIAGTADTTTIRGDNLQLQYVGERTLLSELNGGKGVFAGKFRITDRNGLSATIDISQADDTRIEDVISEINSAGIGVTASVNSTGDGLLITDTSGGAGTLKVAEVSGGTTAKDLRILGEAAAADPSHIDGSFEYKITIDAGDTIEEIAAKIKSAGAPVTASIINDGSRTSPYRLSLVSKNAGSVGRMVVDTGGLDFGFVTTQKAEDAVLLYGQQIPGAQRMLVTSASNTITGLVEGLTLSLKGISSGVVNVSVTADDDAIDKNLSQFVSDWNDTVDKIKAVTSFNPETQQAGLLLGDPAIMRIHDALTNMISYNAPGAAPKYNRLSRMGVSFMQTGALAYDSRKLKTALADDRDAVERLFTQADTGLGARFSSVLEDLTDEYTGLIKRKSEQYDKQISVFQSQIDNLTARLSKVQTRLYSEFYAMEEALSRLETQRSAIENMPNYFLYGNTGQKKSS